MKQKPTKLKADADTEADADTPEGFARLLLKIRLPEQGDPRNARLGVDCSLIYSKKWDGETNRFDAYTHAAADAIRKGQPLPDWLRDFAADVLIGALTRPKRRGRKPDDLFNRDFMLWSAAEAIEQMYAMPLYTNNELSDKRTVAHVIAEAAELPIEIVKVAIKKFLRQPAIKRGREARQRANADAKAVHGIKENLGAIEPEILPQVRY
jgi:hypothetical protein